VSGLAAVLARKHDTGIFRWHAAFPHQEVGHAVEHAGWGFGHLDGLGSESKEEFLDRIAEALHFPDYFGRNLDALADCLADVGKDSEGVVLLWDGWGPFARRDPEAFAAVREVLAERATDERTGPFAVLLRGDGPDVPDVTWLD
jgi:RNAse (barnase) inhibitor barstar